MDINFTAQDVKTVLVKPVLDEGLKQELLDLVKSAINSSAEAEQQIAYLLDGFQRIFIDRYVAANPILAKSVCTRSAFIEAISAEYDSALVDWFGEVFPSKKDYFISIYTGGEQHEEE